jgi:exosortase E/protease (VPEID-CTERM system)
MVIAAGNHNVRSAISNPTVLRWSGLIAVALAEMTWLAIRVEVPSTGFLSIFKGFPSIFVTSLTVVAVLGWVLSKGTGIGLPGLRESSHSLWLMVVVHLGVFAHFFWLTIFMTEREAVSSPLAGFWLLAWAATGLGAGVSWMLAAMPARVWIRLVRENASLVLAGIIIVAASCVLGFLTNRVWEPLLGPTFLAVKWLLLGFGQEVLCQPADLVLGTPQFAVGIYPACAGYEGIGLMTVFVGSYLWLFRGSLQFPRAFVLLPCGILVMWLVNAVRITLLVLFGTYVSPEIAVGGFHSATGWIGFIAVALCMVAVTQRMPFFAVGQTAARAKAREGDPTAAYLAPLMALLALIMVTTVFTSGFDGFYPVRVVGTAGTIWFFWRNRLTRSRFAGCWSWSAVGIGAAVFAVWMGLEWVLGNAETAPSLPGPLAEMPVGLAAGWLAFRVIGSVITVPIAEELAFRGYALRRLVSPDFDKVAPRFTWVSFLVSSFLFGALHGRWIAGTLAGMLYAWAMYRRGRLGDAIIAHATTNALIAGWVSRVGEGRKALEECCA